ncbi:MAG: DUF3795 domain-containing protein [Promethearchaeota archaeon]
MVKEHPIKKYPTIACCGLDCGLCPTYYTQGPSKCPGCCGPDFFNKHPSCSIITCCVKTNNFETCAECDEFPCSKIDKWDRCDSFISHRVSLSNLRLIKQNGLNLFIEQQEKRIKMLEKMLENFNEGRSKSFYCSATALLTISDLKYALEESENKINKEKIDSKNLKANSKILKAILNNIAEGQQVELKLRRKQM